MNPPLDKVLAQLAPLLKQRKLVLFAGAGISVPSGLPTWHTFIDGWIGLWEKYLPVLPDTHDIAGFINQFRHEPERFDLTIVASVLRDRLLRMPSNVQDIFRDQIQDTFRGEPNANHRHIVKCAYPFILTTNYDNLLERAADAEGFPVLTLQSYSFNQIYELAEQVYQALEGIVHIHGNLNDFGLDKAVFAREDYIRIRLDQGFRILMQSFFTSYAILFVGYGAKDPHLEGLLDEMAFLFDWRRASDNPRHFIVLPREEADPFFNEYKRNQRAQVIEIDSESELTTLLAALQQAAPRTK